MYPLDHFVVYRCLKKNKTKKKLPTLPTGGCLLPSPPAVSTRRRRRLSPSSPAVWGPGGLSAAVTARCLAAVCPSSPTVFAHCRQHWVSVVRSLHELFDSGGWAQSLARYCHPSIRWPRSIVLNFFYESECYCSAPLTPLTTGLSVCWQMRAVRDSDMEGMQYSSYFLIMGSYVPCKSNVTW